MAQSVYEKKLRRKYGSLLSWAEHSYTNRDEKLLETVEMLKDKIDEYIDNAAEDFPSQIFSPVYRALYAVAAELTDFQEILEDKVYSD